MSTFDDTGLVVDRFDEVKEALITDLQAAFGDDIKTTDDSVFGQIINIFAEAVADQNELVEQVKNAFTIYASGQALSDLVKINGINRNEAEFSTVQVELTANAAGATVPSGSLIEHVETGEQFETVGLGLILPNATISISAKAVNPGPIEAQIGKLTKIVNPVFGWDSVTNPVAATPGANEETDTELRARREIAASAAGPGTVGSILTAILDLDDVEAAQVYQNNGQSTDSFGIPRQHIFAVVLGGLDPEIAQTIFDNVGGGIGTFGTETENVTEPITGIAYDIKFSRPSQLTVYIDLELVTNEDFPGDGEDQIKANLVSYGEENQGIGIDVIYSRLFTPINEVPGHYVNSLTVGYSPSPVGTSNLSVDLDEQAVITTAAINITVT